jgi:glycosyltransferase involved in cell wall biosynthesis
MRILLINHYAGSPARGMEYRPFYFAREWSRSGHQVLIAAASFSHLRQSNPVFAGPLLQETCEGVDYLWVKTPSYDGNGLARARNMAAFILGLATKCQDAIETFKPDAIVASSTYTWDNWVAARYAKRFGATYVYEVHDLWPLSPMELGGMSARNPFIWSLQKAEDFACRHAERVISLLPHAADHLAQHGMSIDKFVYIPNGIVAEEWDETRAIPEDHRRILTDIRRQSRFLVGYAGGHGLSNALDALVEAGAAAQLKDVHIVCVGSGPEKTRLQQKAQALGSRVVFLSPVPRVSVPGLLALFDALYIGWSRSPLYRYGISPNKLYEYMMAGIPILHAVDAANDPVRDAECGISVAPEDADAVRDGILRLAALSVCQREEMGRRGRAYVLEHHDLSQLAQRFLDCLVETADSRGETPSSSVRRGTHCVRT